MKWDPFWRDATTPVPWLKAQFLRAPVYQLEERGGLRAALPASPSATRRMLVGIRGGQCVERFGMRGAMAPELPKRFGPPSATVFCGRAHHTVEFESMAEVLSVCRLGDERCSSSAEPSQSCFALGIDKEDFLKVEGIAVALICSSSDTKEFLRPQASQSAFKDEQPGVARLWQCNSQHAPDKCMHAAKLD